MKRVIKYVIEMGNKGLEMKPQKTEMIMNIVSYSDSDFVRNKESKTSVFGFIILLNNEHISWNPKAQLSVKLSSSEDDYVVFLEAAK